MLTIPVSATKEGICMKEEKCPNCGAKIMINFSEEETKGNDSRNVICPTCNGYSTFPAGIGQPHFHPHALDQDSRPRVLRA